MTTFSPEQPLAGRIIAVTGASRGIGHASALALAKAGAHVVAIARTQGGLETLDDAILAATGTHATLVPMDLTDAKAPDLLGASLYERWGHLDGLVAAAGDLGVLTPMGHMEPRTFERVMAVNVTANWRLLRSFDPLFKRATDARITMLTSRVATTPRAFWGAYAASKAALETLLAVYADEVENTTIRTTILDPGAMRTRMRAAAYPGEDPDTLTPPEAIGPLVVDLMRPDRVPPARIRYADWAAG
jgi:NAD(P)-dependent dehydrogenase (short-subunit alcohol dehydrogenase family)